MIRVLVFFFSFNLLFLIIDFCQRKVITHWRWSRKATHVLSGGIIYLMPYWLSRNQIFWIAIAFLAILSFSRWKKILSLHTVDRDTIGEILYPVSIGFLALICLPENVLVFQASSLVLALSDGFAGIIGEALDFKTVSLGKHKKSLGGALTFFGTSLLVLLVVYGARAEFVFPILGIAIILTGAEFLLVYGSDNLIIPVLAALLLLYFLV